jgi:drug/metabolite transporter (DMT)-like permease
MTGRRASTPGPSTRLPAGTLPTLALVFATAAWGSSFIVIKGAVAHLPAADFLAVRFAIAAAALVVLRPRLVRSLTRPQAGRAVALGAVYGIAQLLQTVGLEHLSASTSGFVTGLYVVFTPFLGWALMGRRISAMTVVAVVVAAGGLAILCLNGATLGLGFALTLGCALLYGVHIVGLGAWSEPQSAYGTATVQMAVVALVCSLAAVGGGHAELPSTFDEWWRIGFTALGAGAAAMLAQTWAQAHLEPTRAAVIMTLEPVFAALFAIWPGGEAATWRLSGGLLVVVAMYLVETGPAPGGEERRGAPQLAEGG